MPPQPPPTAADIHRARLAIRGHVRHTPLVPAAALSARLGRDVRYKLESLQDIGAFKIRGAANALASLSPAQRRAGVIAVSSGNHGRGLASAGRRLGVPVTICLTAQVPEVKIEAIRALGARVEIAGDSQDEAEQALREIAGKRGLIEVSPFDDPAVIAGQGTIGLELLEDWPDLRAAIVPLSGGGLIAGIALALKAVSPEIRVIGVSMARGPAMVLSQRAGRPVPVEELPTLADGLAGGIGLDNRHTFALVRDLVDDMVLVEEAEIAAAMRFAFREDRLVIEGAAAVGIAALLQGRIADPPDRSAVVISGRNVDMATFATIVGPAS